MLHGHESCGTDIERMYHAPRLQHVMLMGATLKVLRPLTMKRNPGTVGAGPITHGTVHAQLAAQPMPQQQDAAVPHVTQAEKRPIRSIR